MRPARAAVAVVLSCLAALLGVPSASVGATGWSLVSTYSWTVPQQQLGVESTVLRLSLRVPQATGAVQYRVDQGPAGWASAEDGKLVAQLVSDLPAEVTFSDVEGRLLWSVTVTEARVARRVSFVPDGPQTIRAAVGEELSLSGRLVDDRGEPVRGADVMVWDMRTRPGCVEHCDKAGKAIGSATSGPGGSWTADDVVVQSSGSVVYSLCSGQLACWDASYAPAEVAGPEITARWRPRLEAPTRVRAGEAAKVWLGLHERLRYTGWRGVPAQLQVQRHGSWVAAAPVVKLGIRGTGVRVGLPKGRQRLRLVVARATRQESEQKRLSWWTSSAERGVSTVATVRVG